MSEITLSSSEYNDNRRRRRAERAQARMAREANPGGQPVNVDYFPRYHASGQPADTQSAPPIHASIPQVQVAASHITHQSAAASTVRDGGETEPASSVIAEQQQRRASHETTTRTIPSHRGSVASRIHPTQTSAEVAAAHRDAGRRTQSIASVGSERPPVNYSRKTKESNREQASHSGELPQKKRSSAS